MDDLARKRAKRFAHISKKPRRSRISFRRFWRTAHKSKEQSRDGQRKTAMALWKALGKVALGTRKHAA